VQSPVRLMAIRAASWIVASTFCFAVAFLLESGMASESSPPEGSRPNVILIITDDQGYGDLSAHGNPILKTPHLDRLHASSRRFTDFQVSPTCAPTRSALLTGRHEFRNGVTHTILERERLRPDATTLAEVLRLAGYGTGIFGKWHLGDEDAYQPQRRGFDKVCIHGAGGIGQSYAGSCGDAPGNRYHDPYLLVDGVFEKTEGYCTDLYFSKAMEWIENRGADQQEKPFFCLIATNAPHSPYVARPQDAALYQGKAPNVEVENFFGMIHNIDQNVGRLLDFLESDGLRQQTLVVFMNDNGGTAGVSVFNAGMRGAKGTAWLGGTRASSFWSWPGRIEPGDCDRQAAHVDFFPTIAQLAGVEWNASLQGQVEGKSLLPLLQDPKAEWESRRLVTHLGRWPDRERMTQFKYKQCSVRDGKWHLVSADGGLEPAWQLYDLQTDPSETKDVAADHPDVKGALEEHFERWWESIQKDLVNEGVKGPPENSFKTRFLQQYGVQAAKPKAPASNILFAFADDWGRYAGCYRGLTAKPGFETFVATPSIDAIARRGVVFRHAFAPAPSCTPCRSSLISGQYFWRTSSASILQGARWDDRIETFSQGLQQRGRYQLGRSHKGWSPGMPADAPLGGRKNGFEQAGSAINNFSEEVTRRMNGGASLEAAREEILGQVEANFEAFLAQRDRDRPFFYWFGPTLIHRLFVQGSGKSLWGIDPDRLQGHLPEFLPDVPEVREDVADYLGEIQAWDAAVGRLMVVLERHQLLDNTLVMLSGDHGMPGMPRGKCNLYDFGTAVPLIAAGPSVPAVRVVDDLVSLMDLAPTWLEWAGVEVPELMAGRSLLPQLMANHSGQVEVDRDFVLTGRERHVADAREDGLPYPQRALRTSQYLYIRNFHPDRWPMGSPKLAEDPAEEGRLAKETMVGYTDMDASPTKAWLIANRGSEIGRELYRLAFAKRPFEELYLLESDPDQVHNVASEPEHEDLLYQLRSRMDRELLRWGDPRMVGRDDYYETPPMAGSLPAKK